MGGFNNFEHKMMQRMLACLGVQNDLIKASIIIYLCTIGKKHLLRNHLTYFCGDAIQIPFLNAVYD